MLPGISERLGQLTRTNSESILTVEARDLEVDYSVGPAITSSIHPNEQTHVEPVRYGRGSNAMGLLSTVLTEGDRPGEPTVPWRAVRRRRAEGSAIVPAVAVRPALVGADHGDAGHAEPRQLPEPEPEARPVRVRT